MTTTSTPGTVGASPSSGLAVLSGTLTAPAGVSVRGTIVIACATSAASEDRDSTRSQSVRIDVDGTVASWQLNVLPAQYDIAAWNDSNADGEIDDGDPFDSYSVDGIEDTLLTPPLGGIQLLLELLQTEGPPLPGTPAGSSGGTSSGATTGVPVGTPPHPPERWARGVRWMARTRSPFGPMAACIVRAWRARRRPPAASSTARRWRTA